MLSACSTMETLERSEGLMEGGSSSATFSLIPLMQSDYLCLSSLSGRSPRAQTLGLLEGRGYTAEAPPSDFDALNVTVPGAAACWCDTVQLFGSQKVCVCLCHLSRKACTAV